MANPATVSIPLTKGVAAIIDSADAHLVLGRKWYAAGGPTSKGYAYTANGKGKSPLALHRFLLNAPDGMVVDHINGDGLDNRRCNIRLCTQGQNNTNQRVQQTERKISRFKGVTWKSRGKPWGAAIQQNGARLFIGSYRTEEEAARAYDATAKVIHGRFACTNASMNLFDKVSEAA